MSFVHRISANSSGYLLVCWYVLLEMSPMSLCPWVLIVPSVGTLEKKITSPRPTFCWIKLDHSFIISSKWAEFRTYVGDFHINGLTISKRGWRTELWLLTMGPNRMASLWILRRPYMWGSFLWRCDKFSCDLGGKWSLFLIRICHSFLFHYWGFPFFNYSYQF